MTPFELHKALHRAIRRGEPSSLIMACLQIEYGAVQAAREAIAAGDMRVPAKYRFGIRLLRPCGTHAAHNRHVLNGEMVDEACRLAELVYDRDKHRRYARRRGAA